MTARTAIDSASKARELVKHRLLSGEYRPGQMVSLRALARLTGLTLASTREALQRLAFDGLVRIHPHRGIQLAEMNVAFVREAFQLRLLIEKEGARKLAELGPDRVFDEMEAMTRADLEALQAGISDALRRRVTDTNRRFHAPLIDAHNSSMIADIYRANQERIGFINRNVNLPPGGDFTASMTEHLAIVAALRARRPDAAASAFEDHINAALRRVTSL